MTDEGVADAIYIEPLTPEVVKRVIQRERPERLPTLRPKPDSTWRSRSRTEVRSSDTVFACSARHFRQSNRQKTARCFETF